MIAYIRGTLAYIEPEESMAVLETGGIGYRILMSGRDLDLLPAAGEELRLYTYLQVREDAFVLERQWHRPEGGPWSTFRSFRR